MLSYAAENQHKLYTALADLGGHAGCIPPPMGPNSFIFAYIFTKKCPCQRSTPPNRCMPPLWEILDPPLHRSAMVDHRDESADAQVISFKLGDILQSNNIKFDEINENEVPDTVLVELLQDVSQGNDAFEENPRVHPQNADNISTEPNQFPDLTSEEIDD